MGETRNGRAAALVPSGAREPPGYQCLRSLGRAGVHTIYGKKYDSDTIPASRYCDEAVSLPDPDEDVLAYRDRLLEIAERPDVRTIVPTNEYDAYVLSKFHESFAGEVSLPVPPFESLHTVHDRVRLAEAAEAAGVPVPETRPFDEVEDWNRELIVKSRYNLLAHDYDASLPRDRVDIVKDVTYLDPGEVPDREETVDRMGHVPIVQECVPRAAEYMVGALYDRGEPVATLQLRQIREDSYKGGGGVYRKSMYDRELERVARDLLAELDWHGLACLEYMEDEETGEYKLAEINPRMWQSLVPAVRAGVDFPYYYWLLANGRRDLIDPEPRVGVGSHLIRGEVNHLQSIVDAEGDDDRPNLYATVGEMVVSTLLEPRFDTLRLDDPRPFAEGVLSGLRERMQS
ncbi:carboxylate--amine ligase [Halorussus sp. AFM4]|uniref:carboxylate--amine ligase n=1 Tax=Halorussus sp. AFM4 TaxID=3421651 RepID=UPI003EBFF5CE